MLALAVTSSTAWAQCQLCTPYSYAAGQDIDVRLVFVAFPDGSGNPPVQDHLPPWADEVAADFDQFLEWATNSDLTTNTSVLRRPDDPNKAWIAQSAASVYAAGRSCAPIIEPHYGTNNAELIQGIWEEYNKEGNPNIWSGVDVLIVVNYQQVFCTFAGIAGLGLPSGFVPPPSFAPTGGISMMLSFCTDELNAATTPLRVESALAHEFGHLFMGGGHPYPGNAGNWLSPCSGTCGQAPNPAAYINLGNYTVMGGRPLAAPEIGFRGYEPIWWTGANLETVVADYCLPPQTVRVPNYRASNGKRVTVDIADSDQYFVMANFQGTLHDSKYGGTGLLIWHGWPSNPHSLTAWDLESAAGKVIDPATGLPGGTPDPNTWWDLLEANVCNMGSGGDFFDGTPGKNAFTPFTNPNTNLYSTTLLSQTVASDIYFDNIRYDGTDILVDVYRKKPPAAVRKGPGESITINWNLGVGFFDWVNVYLSTGNGCSFPTYIGQFPHDNLQAQWTVPAGFAPGNDYRFRIEAVEDPGFNQETSPFTIWDMQNVSIGSYKSCQQFTIVYNWKTSAATNGLDYVEGTTPQGAETSSTTFSTGTDHYYTHVMPCQTGTYAYELRSQWSPSGSAPWQSAVSRTGTIANPSCPCSPPPCGRPPCEFDRATVVDIVEGGGGGLPEYAVKEFQVPAGTVVQGVRFHSPDAKAEFDEVLLLENIDAGMAKATVLRSGVARSHEQHDGAGIAQAAWDALDVSSDRKLYVAVRLSRKSDVGQAIGVLDQPGSSYMIVGGALPRPLGADLAMDLVLGREPNSRDVQRVFLSARPNPMNSETVVNFGLADKSDVKLTVYDISGRVVRTLYQGQLGAGEHEFPWNGRDVSGRSVAVGIYFVKLNIGGTVLSSKIIRAS